MNIFNLFKKNPSAPPFIPEVGSLWERPEDIGLRFVPKEVRRANINMVFFGSPESTESGSRDSDWAMASADNCMSREKFLTYYQPYVKRPEEGIETRPSYEVRQYWKNKKKYENS